MRSAEKHSFVVLEERCLKMGNFVVVDERCSEKKSFAVADVRCVYQKWNIASMYWIDLLNVFVSDGIPLYFR